MMQVIFGGLALGMVSSLHCVGMCGPIGLSLPLGSLPATQRAISFTIYHLGRILTYSALGLVFGLLGRTFYISGLQQAFSVLAGVSMLLGVIYFTRLKSGRQPLLLRRFNQRLQQFIVDMWKAPGGSRFFLIGAANGLLPCGMVYVAIAGAMTFSQPGNSIFFMAMFGAGTLPALLGLRYFAGYIHRNLKYRLSAWTPYLIGFMAILLILRGLNLGIPLVSPVMPGRTAVSVSCH